jgi:hypothetical protein
MAGQGILNIPEQERSKFFWTCTLKTDKHMRDAMQHMCISRFVDEIAHPHFMKLKEFMLLPAPASML